MNLTPILHILLYVSFLMLFSCSTPKGKTKENKKPRKLINRDLEEQRTYESLEFKYSFTSPVKYIIDESFEDSLIVYESFDQNDYIDIFIWNERDYAEALSSVDSLGAYILNENSIDTFEVVDKQDGEAPQRTYKILSYDYEDSAEEAYQGYYTIIWNKSEKTIIEASLMSEDKDSLRYLTIAKSFTTVVDTPL